MTRATTSLSRRALFGWPALLRAAVALVLAQWLLTSAHYFPSCRIDDLFEVLVILSINNLDLLHPATGFPVEIVAGETFHNGLAFPFALDLVLKAGVQSNSNAIRSLELKCLRCPLTPEPHQLQERCPHTPILAFANALFDRLSADHGRRP